METKTRFTETLHCGHCGNSAPMKVIGHHTLMRDHDDPSSGMCWSAGMNYELSCCPACEGVILRRYYFHDGAMDPSDVVLETLYPTEKAGVEGLPAAVEKGFFAASRVRGIDPNAYAVLLRRVLELLCLDRDARGNTLHKQLEHLAQRGEIPQKLVDVAAALRQLGNIGAHASLGEITENEVPVLEDLCRAVLDYVYRAPFLAQRAEESLQRMTGKADQKVADHQR